MPSPHDLPALPDPDEIARRVASLRRTSPLFGALLERYGQLPPALRHHGLIQWQTGDVAGAVETFRAALGLTPADHDLWRDLASAHDASGQPALARAAAAAALHQRPDDVRAWLMFANLNSRMGAQAEAETAFRRVLAFDAGAGEAHFGLGLIAFDHRRMDEAAASIRAAIACGYATALGYTALGHVLFVAGSFADCASAFETAALSGPLEASALRKYARARTYALMIEGDAERAAAGYAEIAGAEAEDPAAMLRDAFSALSGYGHLAAARAVGRIRLARDPGDPVQRYLLDAVSGEALTRAPVDYIEKHFDGFAETFDQKLVDVLGYRAPQDMARMVAATGRCFAETLDLGCGTGLAAAPIAPFCGRLTGVDLSGGMLAEAARRGLYADLVKAEALAYLAENPARFDLVVAADLMIYFGDLGDFFAGVALATRPGGLFALSTETAEDIETFKLMPSGRFVHAVGYVDRMAAEDFTILSRETASLRLEAGRPAAGLLLLMERRKTGGSLEKLHTACRMMASR